MHTWVLCQSLLQPAGRDAHAGDAPPESTEDLQRIQTLGQRPRVDAKVFEQAFNLCTKWWCQEVIPTLCNALHSVSVLSVRCARHFTDVIALRLAACLDAAAILQGGKSFSICLLKDAFALLAPVQGKAVALNL